MIKQQHVLQLSLAGMLAFSSAFGQSELSTDPESDFKIDDTGELKIFTDLLIPEGEIRTGKLRVIGGNLTVIGTVTGRITVIGGDVEIMESAVVEGTIIALGGKLNIADGAEILGEVLEINSGKLSLSRKQTEDVFGSRGDAGFWEKAEELEGSWNQEDYADDDFDDDRSRSVKFSESIKKGARIRLSHRRRVRTDFQVPSDVIFRYNRAEGAAIYIPFSPDTYDLTGFHIQGLGGYAAGPKMFYGRLAIGQYLLDHRLGVIAEGHLQPKNNDTWRVAPEENLLGALLIHEDWYDWYEADGYGGSVVAYPLSWLNFGGQYLFEKHSRMPTTVNWSLFGNDKVFRDVYAITAGQDVNMTYHVNIGDPVGLFHRRFKAHLGGTYTSTMPGGDFNYTRQELNAGLFLNFQRRLGFRAIVKAGATLDNSSDGTGYGLQHLVPIGGVGSLGGYDYKDRSGSHFAIINLDFSLLERKGDILSLLWQYGSTWDADYNLLSGDYLDDLQTDARQSIGFRFGGEDTRFEVFQTLTGDKKYAFYFRFMDF